MVVGNNILEQWKYQYIESMCAFRYPDASQNLWRPESKPKGMRVKTKGDASQNQTGCGSNRAIKTKMERCVGVNS